jgi:peptide/nickel transport system permease protein
VTNIATAEPSALEIPEQKDPLGWFFWLCASWLILIGLSALFAPLLPLKNPNFQDYTWFNTGPSHVHLLGTDELGRDLLSRLIYGARVSLEISLGAMLIGFVIGGSLGMLAAYRRGTLDLVLTSVISIGLAFPAIVAVIAVLSFWTPSSAYKITVVVGITAIPLVYRVIRASALSVGSREFVTAAKVQGASDWRIVFREVLPNVAPTGLSFLLFGVATTVTLEGVLAFLGLSVQTPAASWGTLINEGAQQVLNYGSNWSLTLFPVLDLCLFILCINFVGDRLRAYFDVAEVKL